MSPGKSTQSQPSIDAAYPRGIANAALVSAIPAISAISAAVLAHQGGWDEILLVVAPIAVVVGLLSLARRRTRRPSATGDVGTD